MMMRRRTILGVFATCWVNPVSLAHAREETGRIQREIIEATARGRAYALPPGTTPVTGFRLPDGAHLVGQADRSKLLLVGDGPLLVASGARRITLESVQFDGAGRAANRDMGLLQMRDVADLRMSGCGVTRFGGNGMLMERCGGRITGSQFSDHGRAGVFALDSRQLSLDANTVERCGENGLAVWQSAKREDGTLIRGNRISDIRANAVGSGEYGNAIALYRAGGVVVEGNVIRRVAYTGVRNNSGSNVVVRGNSIQQAGEVAIYSEFSFDGAAISGNTVQDAWVGIEIVNYADHGGRLSAVSGNVIRGIRQGRHPSNGAAGGGLGIFVEGDSAVSGNIVEGAETTGLRLGWGPSLRDVTATGNTLRACADGIQISVAPGAGAATVVGNTISGATRAAIIGMQWDKRATGDLARADAKAWPKLRLADNTVV
jgi:uncharacterized secreted repeat protein (TIGR03808 family)